jgi:hypothetical protein
MQTEETLSLGAVCKRLPLLRRVATDLVDCYEKRGNWREFLQELSVIQKKFSSPEITETMNRLRQDIAEADRSLEYYESEIRNLGGILKDPRKGLIYFYSQRDDRRIFLIWELGEPDLIYWHELDESFSDRLPVRVPEDAVFPGETTFPEDRVFPEDTASFTGE